MEFCIIFPPHLHRQGLLTFAGLCKSKMGGVFFCSVLFCFLLLLQGYKKNDAKVEVNTEVLNIITFQHHAIVVVGSKPLFSFAWLTLWFVLTTGYALGCFVVGFFS